MVPGRMPQVRSRSRADEMADACKMARRFFRAGSRDRSAPMMPDHVAPDEDDGVAVGVVQ
jgi:hypothetical protein